ncbi:MAG: hypothetical protein methR_P1236 [Methyloprofundus sp.]|nr:MAG: hypothetical protein methR_P1236 [Methyloprofundus sp.]
MLAWFMWGLASLYFLFDFINQVIPAALGPELRTAFNADATTFGLISSCYFYSYALLQIPVGLSVDRFGPRRPLTVAAIVAGTGCLLFSMADSPLTAAMTRMLVGAGAAFSFVSCLKLVANWFPANRFATLVGLTNIIGMIGAISGEGPIAALGEKLGWQETLWIIAALGWSLALIIFVLLQDKPAGDSHAPAIAKSAIWSNLRYLLRQRDAWLVGLYAATINTSFIAFAALWGSEFIHTAFDVTFVQAASITSLVFVGAIPGSFFFGWLSDKIQRFKLPMLIGSGGGLLSLCVLLYVPALPLGAVYGLLFSLGFFCCGNVVAYAYNASIGSEGAEGLSLGYTNTWLIGGSALFQPLIGWLLDKHSMENHSQHVSAFTPADFQFALSSIVICLLIAFICALLIKENYKKN